MRLFIAAAAAGLAGLVLGSDLDLGDVQLSDPFETPIPFADAVEYENFTAFEDDFSSSFGLDTRQTSCPQGTFLCSHGRCCPQGYSCVPGGCCSGNKVKCGSSSCYDPSVTICCGESGYLCQKGFDCVGGGKCCRSGMKPCEGKWCYNPETQICCRDGACPRATKCCKNSCCRSFAYCSASGECEHCPMPTRTITSTTSYTTTTYSTRTFSTGASDPDTIGFTCLPVTATNAAGDVLELGDDCAFSFQPAETTTDGLSARATDSAKGDDVDKRHQDDVDTKARVINVLQAIDEIHNVFNPPEVRDIEEPEVRDIEIKPRQNSCTPYTTWTETYMSTSTITSTSVYTYTTSVTPTDFQCPTMAVTDSFGNELSLNTDCEFELKGSLEPTTTGGDIDSSGNGSGVDPDSGAGVVRKDVSVCLAALVGWAVAYL